MIGARRRLTAFLGTQTDDPQFVSNILRFRKRVFVDSLGWDLTVIDGKECDEFDSGDALYCGVLADGEIVGCFRALRCDRPYLSKEKFQHLATYRNYPSHPFAWEISRFAVSEQSRNFEICLVNYALMFYLARQEGAVSLVAFCDISHERLLSRLGIVTERFGDPADIGEDGLGRPIRVVAGEIPVSKQNGHTYRKMMRLVETMEVVNGTAVVGRPRVSA
ncbi:MAG: GNAT family N-acetyltransferase [Hyphomicrobiales bacterium]|nr:GNAT family N-acetyltransferase [Hyphomicrobiales bacterium]